MKIKLISVVIPSFNEEGNVEIICNKLVDLLDQKQLEIIFVDDGSTDQTLLNIRKLSKKYSCVKYLSFSRNFGHQSALKAGLDYSKGDCVVSIDCDLQHPPELITKMLEKWNSGYDIVYTVRDDSRTPFFKKMTAAIFYKLINSLSDLDIEPGAADFRLLDRKVVEIIKSNNERALFLRGLINWVGFKSFALKYLPNKRYSGVTKYSFKKMLMLATDGITSFSTKPLKLSTYLGFFLSLFSSVYAIYAIILHFTNNKVISGWTSVIISILFLGGIQLLILGIIGEYIGKMFIETKKRPMYIISDSNL